MSIEFNGTTGHLNLASILQNKDFSVAAWFWPNVTEDAGLYGIVGFEDNSVESGGHIMRTKADGKLRGESLDVTVDPLSVLRTSADTANTYTEDAWNLGICSFSLTKVRASLNGGSVAVSTGFSPPTPSLDKTRVGRDHDSGYFDGRIAELAIWNDDILNDANTDKWKAALWGGADPRTINPTALVALFRFWSADLRDSVGKVAWTANGSPTAAQHPRIWYRRGGQLIEAAASGIVPRAMHSYRMRRAG